MNVASQSARFSTDSKQAFRASVVISTKNRKDDLRRAVQSALLQQPPVEIIVLDDGSTDGTSEMLRAQFPQVQVRRFETSSGYIVQRNRGAALASASILVTIDDDAVFASPNTVEQSVQDFDHPRIGAVAIPYLDVHRGPGVKQRAPSPGLIHVTSAFRGTACALRRDIFLALGGFKESFVHQGEEDDYCARMLRAGYVTRLGSAEPIRHYESPKRDWGRIMFYQARNHVLFSWHNVPTLFLPVHLGATIYNCLRSGFRDGYAAASLKGCLRALAQIPRTAFERRPLSFRTYRLLRRLKKCGPLSLEGIRTALPPPIPGLEQTGSSAEVRNSHRDRSATLIVSGERLGPSATSGELA